MIARVAKHLSFSNVIACLALFIALGGSVYAAGQISGKQIKKNSLPGNRIKPKTIPSNRIKPNSLSGKQINEATLTGVSAAALAEVRYEAVTADLPWGTPSTVTANCPSGSYAIGGGATLSSDQGYVVDDGPSSLRTGWTATAYRYSSNGVAVTVTAVCVVVQKPGGAANSTSVPAPPVQYEPFG